jgi:hypothetical protein
MMAVVAGNSEGFRYSQNLAILHLEPYAWMRFYSTPDVAGEVVA